ncbi:hypothetical protein QR674_07725 [Acinetobacter chinensis]|uniref:XRE family transcriptional regulator n=1 Tax=Acinetobacter chinensis TaxID=2004650 RepID=A0ABU3WEN0_9GAMM|nr:hypothetical protein [Acinetobacter chinensis]MDV2468871.1 hypothetical protein [Acinetobacter chinensis]
MQTLYKKLVAHFGSQIQTASALQVSQANVSGYVSGRWNMSEIVAMRAELATSGKFKAVELCPSLKEFQKHSA